MDKEYIERGALLESEEWDRLNNTDELRARAIVMCHPAADVVEVKHGRWKGGHIGWVTCSLCKYENNIRRFPYCPNCGALMDGGEP